IIGMAKAKELIFSAEPITGQQALEIGLVNKVVPANRLLEEVEEVAGKILRNSSLALSYAKSLVNRSYYTNSFDEALALEREAFARCCESPDKRIRIDAALERRGQTSKKGVSVNGLPSDRSAAGD